ncbi:hypothetical protein A3D45_00520 [Candidatus Falkowbacteria bacterium RIFCSPHIGHO2_02_FULL_42_9]|uniref:Uncharacterized protein n=1 Tax=Candidatus Falkowbacteria bacterium RIFCSPHIGHO2_02_FULL_42_9 TaxID=1797986 RepID=A0A1F5S613_9BACT|nr:MAG: hypothetical protein A3D45_00520 [Candidatus Falkowbacteria bacterium RIFCSPHIGHO2_02_FULL_42_9]
MKFLIKRSILSQHKAVISFEFCRISNILLNSSLLVFQADSSKLNSLKTLNFFSRQYFCNLNN